MTRGSKANSTPISPLRPAKSKCAKCCPTRSPLALRHMSGWANAASVVCFNRRQRIAQLKERDVEVLRDQFFEEGLMRSALSLAARRTLEGWGSMASGSHLARPSRTCCW